MSGSKTSTTDRAVEAYLTQARARVDAVLQSWGVRAGDWWQAPVPAAMRYSLLSTGKRLRPTLVFAAAEAVGGGVAAERVADLAAAVEVVHCYSLVHDDLPAMDNDDLRRGRATTHKAFDEATAVLAGDGLLTFAFDILSRSETHAEAEVRSGLVSALARAAGLGGMVGGQMLDLAAEGRFESSPPELGEQEIETLQAMKTGA